MAVNAEYCLGGTNEYLTQGKYRPPKGVAKLYYSIGTEICEDMPTVTSSY